MKSTDKTKSKLDAPSPPLSPQPSVLNKSRLKAKKEKNLFSIRSYYHYAFPVLLAIFIFALFTQYLFNQFRENNKSDRLLQIEQLRRLNEEKLRLIDDLNAKTSLDDKIILNSFRSKYSQEELAYKREIDLVESLIDQNEYKLAVQQLKPLMKQMPFSQRCLYSSAYLIDKISETEKSNFKLLQSIEIYKKLFSLGDLHKSLLYVAGRRLVNRLQFVGKLNDAISYGEYLNKLIPSNVNILNDLGISYLMNNKLKQAKDKFELVLSLTNNNLIAICHYAFILKNYDNRLEESVIYFKNCINSNETIAMDARFFYHLGDSLQKLNRTEEAFKYYEQGVQNGFFNSIYQRSLYNEPNLRAKPVWDISETGYENFFRILESNWEIIRNEAIAQINQKTKTFQPEEPSILNKGDWRQFNLYLRGKKLAENCARMPLTCELLDEFEPASKCSRCQIQLSLMSPGVHVWPHCGPTNTRLRSHLGLVIPNNCCRIRIANETYEWEEGKVFVFDDSFEHEVWHNGSETYRLVLIIDFWHPDLEKAKWSHLNPL